MKRAVPTLTLVLVALAVLTAGTQAALIHLEAYTFDPSRGEPVLPADLTTPDKDAAGHRYFLAQCAQRVTPEWTRALEASGATLYGYVSEDTWLIGADSAARDRLAALPAMAWIGSFHPAYRLDPAIGLAIPRTPERLADPNLTLMVRAFRDLDGVAAQIEALGGRILDRTDDGFSRRLVVGLAKEKLHDVARLDDVWWIEEKPEFRTWNNTTKWVVQSNSSGWTPIWDHGIYGEGQIFTIMDSGVDYNACWFRETDSSAPGPSHRKVINYSTYGGNPYDGCATGHGSHVAGTVAGDQSYINPGNFNYNGMAYKAKFAVQDVGADDSWACTSGSVNVPSSLAAAFTQSYGLGARLHTNSWGSSSNAYDGYSVDVDNAMWQHPDFLICFAAGNSGPSGSTVGSPGTAKNCITVGATKQAPSQETMASYSSRGPASDSRYKPTLTAPGGEDPTFITSVDNATGNPPPATCNTASSPFQGTSMATPAVSGCALNVRQYYVDGFYPSGATGGTSLLPSAALIKSTLVSSTKDMSTGDIPNNNEGWGRVLVDNALYFSGDTRELYAHDVTPGLSVGENWSFDFTVDSSAEPLVISLVWTDYPGTSGSGVKLINDLDLLVTAPDGTQYKGNVFSGGFSNTGGNHDRLNVEECVRRANPAVGTWNVRVNGYNVPHGPQPFALTANGAFGNWPTGGADVAAPAPIRAAVSIRANPNPVRQTTRLEYEVPAGYAGPVEILIADVQGRTLRTLVNKGQSAGRYFVTWEGLDQLGYDVPDGVYFARITTGDRSASTKLVVRR